MAFDDIVHLFNDFQFHLLVVKHLNHDGAFPVENRLKERNNGMKGWNREICIG